MAGEWRECALGDVIELKRGYDLPQQDRRPGVVPLVSSSGVTDHHAEAMAKGPGVVTGRYGTLGKVFYVTEDFWPLNTTLYVRDFKGNDARFVSYLLRSLDFLAYSDKAAVPGLNRNHLHQARVVVPIDAGEQRAIVNILGTLDDKIELNRRMNETLEAMARALFKSWFVDFDPVRAKAEGRDPGLPKHIADLFPDSFEDSEMGEIPQGWEMKPLPHEIEVNPSRPLRKGDVAPYLDMANMPTRGHTPADVTDRAFGSGMRFENGDTLVARITPCLENGKTAYVDFLQPGQIGWGSTEYIVLRPKPPLPPEFAYCLARSYEFREFAIQSMTGSSGRQRVPAESLSHYLVPTPTRDVAERFRQFVEPLFSRASRSARESRALAALRDTLLPKLISGELRVKDAEDLVERAPLCRT
ncbi:MAG: restriction endonuclease subunit S [Steroidobacteraceae bacterium]